AAPQETAATQEELVHREATPSKMDTGSKSVTVSEHITAPKKKKKTMAVAAAVTAVLLASGGWFLSRPGKTAIGTLQVASEPAGADILLNGKETDLKTPAILDNLELKQRYTVAVTHPQYGKQEEAISLNNAEPKGVSFKLAKNLGVLNVISDPSGAAILVDGRATGQVTPSTLDRLILNKEYKITLSKPDFVDFDQPVSLASPLPQKLMASLKPVEKATALPPMVPTPPITQPLPPVPAPAEPPPAPEEIIGKISVRSTPAGAKVFLNGKDTGKTTPVVIDDLKQGRYTVRLLKEDFQPLVRGVNIASSKSYSIEERLLEIKKPEKKPVTPAEEPVKEPAKPAAIGGEGSIRITSNPSGADVFVNGEKRGTTPLTVRAKAGKIKVLVTKGDDRLPCRQTISLQAGAETNINCPLGNLFGKVEVSSSPPRAEVFFNGKKLNGKTPLTIEKVKRDKEHTIRLEMNGFKPWERSFDLEDRENKAFNVELER
ncbi:MAG: PEGA domain-containing protein, partial [bacterium]|nr:PEGA domain-containing protein [bacterium]